MGYDGFHIGQVTYGRRSDSELLQLSGSASALYFESLMELQAKVTRLDLQVTVKLDRQTLRPELDGFRSASAFKGRNGRPMRATLTQSNAGGATCYVGSPASNQRGRLYDKYAESGEEKYRNAHRYEVQLRAENADYVAKHLSKVPDKRTFIVSYVWQWFTDRGIVPEFMPAITEPLPPLKRPLTDLTRTLEWLHNAVRPTVHRLVDAGNGNELLEALGLGGLIGTHNLGAASHLLNGHVVSVQDVIGGNDENGESFPDRGENPGI